VNADEAFRTNRAWWDERVPIHARSEFYGLEAFRRGEPRDLGIEAEEVGDVRGLRMLHLQCHFGLTSLTFARLGAEVVGIDFSRPAIELATSLAEEQGLPARFVCANVYDALDAVVERDFDVVFASYGVLAWLPDVPRWTRIAAEFLRPGGRLHLIEIHPFGQVFDDEDPDATEPRVRYPYFHDPEPARFKTPGTYAERDAPTIANEQIEWSHDLAEILGATLEAGLTIQSYRELPTTCYPQFPYLVETTPGEWTWPDGWTPLPLQFALRARKPE
jgi:2-polyprenyl-3-methyl-5-hydroxy-6-metoxy-1,4-benzoquinol methylase